MYEVIIRAEDAKKVVSDFKYASLTKDINQEIFGASLLGESSTEVFIGGRHQDEIKRLLDDLTSNGYIITSSETPGGNIHLIISWQQ